MATVERSRHRGTLKGERWLSLIATEFRAARLALGLSQRAVAEAAGISRPAYSAIELNRLKTLSIMLAARLAALLGLDLFVGIYPGQRGLRDEPSTLLIGRLVREVGAPLRYRTEVPVRSASDRPEQRSWDVAITGHGEWSAFEVERACMTPRPRPAA
jgi:transcriptional regulator with XRE-family HTH domain